MRPHQSRAIYSSIASAIALLFVLSFAIAATSAESKASPAQPQSKAFQNPILWEDLADIDIIRVGDAYYYSASNMHYSPGAPILRSYDLVNWEYVGHSVPVLDFGPQYDLNGGNAYVKGTWASSLTYRKSNKTFYWLGCISGKTYMYTAPAAEGPWNKHTVIDNCYYDAGLLVDDDDTMYVAYGNTKLSVAQLSSDGTKEVKHQQIFESPKELGMIEGSRFYKINGNYYIFITRPANAEYVLRSTTGPFGPYTLHKFAVDVVSPIPNAGYPHQGGIVQTQKGDWYYMGFLDAYPGGRIPVLAPMKFDADGWPVLDAPDNKWLASYPYPLPPHPMKPRTGTDYFRGGPFKPAPGLSGVKDASHTLSPEWEWNHNPDNTKWSVKNGLTLQTATVTDDLYMARNTLTHRILGPESSATIVLDYSAMKDGDRAGLAILRDDSAWVGVKRDGGKYNVVMVNSLTMKGRDWKTASTGTEVASAPISGSKIWLRVSADVRPHFGEAAAATPGRTAKFFYSTDGKKFLPIGEPFTMHDRWQFFMAFRYAIFNYATQSLGGQVKVSSFTMTAP